MQPKEVERHAQLLDILWHNVLFYGQFTALIQRKKQALKAPIETKLRGFIKIMHTNPRNYYAMKEAVHKAHSTVHRHMKEWRAILEQPAKSVMMEPGVDEESAATSWTLPVKAFSSAVEAVDAVDAAALTQSCVILPRLSTYLGKCRRYCKETLKKSPFQARIVAMDDYVGTIIATVDDLQKLKVISGSDKERQKREAKTISMRKRNALSRLMAMLQQVPSLPFIFVHLFVNY